MIRKKQIYTLIGLALVTTLIVVGAWALKSGKFAGWADTGPAEIDIFTHDASNPVQPAGFVDILVSSDGQNYYPASPPLKTQSDGHIIYFDPVFQNHTLYLKASKPYHSVSPDYRQLSVSSGNKYNTDFTVTPIAQESTKGKLKGRVTESGTNNPLNGAFIAVAKGTQVSNTGYSNAQGDYSIANIVPGIYTIISYRNGYQRKEIPNITITANQETTLNISLAKESSPTPTLSNSSSPSPSTQPDSTKFTFIAEVVDAADTDSLVGGVKVEISPNPIINNVYGWEETSTDNPVDETKYDKANLVAEDLLQPTPDCSSKNTTYTVEFSHPAFETQTLPDFYCSDIHFSDNLQIYFYNSHRVSLVKLSEKLTFEFTGILAGRCNSQVKGANVRVFYNEETYYDFTDPSGGFRIWGIPLDINAVYKVSINGGNDYKKVELEFKGSEVIIDKNGIPTYSLPDKPYYLPFSDNLGILKGVVRDADSNHVIEDAVVSLIKNNEITTTFAKTNSRGEYCLKSEPGQFTVFTYHPAYYDNQRAIKEIVLQKGENELNFRLKLIVEWQRYDLYLQLVDTGGQPILVPNMISEKALDGIYLTDYFRPGELYNNYQGELVYENDKQYLKFINVPCGRRINILSDYSFLVDLLDENNKIRESYVTNLVKDTVLYNCSNNIDEKYYYDLKLNRLDISVNDPKKPDVFGRIEYENSCGAVFHYDQSDGIIKATLLQDDQIKYSAEVSSDGRYRIVDVEPGTYEIKIKVDPLSTLSLSRQIEVLDSDFEFEVVDFNWFLDDSDVITKNFFGFDLYFIGPEALGYADSINWEDHIRRLSELIDNLNGNYDPSLSGANNYARAIPILISSGREKNAFFESHDCRLGSGNIGWHIVMDTLLINEYGENISGTLTHEYGHYVHAIMHDNGGNDLESWQKLFIAARKSSDKDCVFQAIRDGNLSQIFNNAGHPWDNSNEFFASFFVAYFQHHERLLSLIRSLPEGSDCRNILEFAWQFFSEKVAKTPGESIDISSLVGSSIRLYNNDDEIFGPVLGGQIGNNIYTPTQIAKGLWKQSVYDNLKPAQKAQLKAILAYRRVLNYLKIDPEKYRNKIDINVVKFNQFIDKMIGTRGDRGGIEGVVKEQKGGPKIPKENIIVIIGKKMAVTDKDGKFRIENIKTGEQKVRVIDGKTSKNLNVDLETVNIQKDKTIKRYFTVD